MYVINMKKALTLLIVLVLLSSMVSASEDIDGLYYSSLMIENGSFVWNVTQSENFYEDIPLGANFTVTLKDNLYPGPLSEEDLGNVYASVHVDGDKYTGEGFPLFWHLYEISDDGTTNTTIREEFEAEPTLFNVTDCIGVNFRVNFTIIDGYYSLDVVLEINPFTGLTEYYCEIFLDESSGTLVASIIELSYIDYYISVPEQTSTPNDTTRTIDGIRTISVLLFLITLGFTIKRSNRKNKEQ